ncbi:hypothetical protein DBR34_16370 [Stenotrophomonas sp. HMWF003]|nr:hypothetical protein DBR34_16370 [Stenotrophomonas sp. HMWF003]
MKVSPAGTGPTTLNSAPGGTLSLSPTLPLRGCPAAVEKVSLLADGVTTRRRVALAQLLGSTASQTW